MRTTGSSLKWIVVLLLVGGALGVFVTVRAGFGFGGPRQPSLPDGVSLVERVREVARLTALDVEVRKQVSYAPDPVPSGSVALDMLHWASGVIRPEEGTLWVAATAHVGLDLKRLDASRIQVRGRDVWLDLPPLAVDVSLDPGATHAIRSNLDADGVTRLLDKARRHIGMDVEHDVRTMARALVAAQDALRGLLLPLGFAHVEFGVPPPLANVASPSGRGGVDPLG